ncbi:MAG: hypothetical protein WD226_10755 [Planctomycetota bacterium]
MDRNQRPSGSTQSNRQLSHLKLISRLLSHELRAQNSPRVTLSRDEVIEIQTALDLYIEDIQRRTTNTGGVGPGHPSGGNAQAGNGQAGYVGGAVPAASELEVRALPTRVN